MKDYRKSDYAINKHRKGIVYRNADGSILEITFEKIAEGNPEFTYQDFEKIKEFSDRMYLEQNRSDARYENHVQGDIQSCEIQNQLKAEYLEDKYFRELLEKEQTGKIHKLIRERLTPIQRRRLLMYMAGISTVKIAEIEGCSQAAIWDSICLAQNKLKKFL